MNDIYSFYQLISKYQIEIPIIQRDYAQGRNNAKAADVREKLVRNIIKAVNDEKSRLFFDFVYGRIDGNKFIPFDGQQRLTTLFLFHKYVFEICQSVSECDHKENCICREILKRFSYATRQSSREFCEKLVQEDVVPSDDKKVSENIRNKSWFYPDWLKDPTIIGMLTMLDEIHNQMNGKKNFKVVAEKLTSGCNCPITFHFVDMGEHKLSDETYVKMNARGKQLTPLENFKASLEQYLEERKNNDLLCRLKGTYDESHDKYTGIDGTWLDLFWKVVNQGNGEKELPDTLMMSFFNRHFMNVWRCWYANNSKSERERQFLSEVEMNIQTEYDTFNDRIQKDMPLHPTKEDFVSFDIYRFVMDKCGVESCLTPIFNICDALHNNNIENDCQAVWNRNKVTNDKWDLFQRDAKNETYRSRAAFYALLKYYENDELKRPTLAQWMRVVWNIIENYVEREESYIPALLLINEIAERTFNISQLGDDYNGVAKDQVKEEIAKAKKILSDNEWESKIIEAETFSFFKGAIRFLFTDAEGNMTERSWKDFDKKWEIAQNYFDKDGNGVTTQYKTDNVLLRTLISYFEKKEHFQAPYYDNSHWRNILLHKKLSFPVCCLLSKDIVRDFNNYSAFCKEDSKLALVQEQLVKTNLLENLPKDGYYIEDDLKFHVYYGHRETTDIYLGDTVHENHILAKLIDENESKGVISCNQRLKKTHFFFGRNINFKYNNNYFQWYGFPRDKNPNNENRMELDVYLMMENWEDYWPRENETPDKDTENGNYFCFKVTNVMMPNDFLSQLDSLISQQQADEKGVPCSNECVKKPINTQK